MKEIEENRLSHLLSLIKIMEAGRAMKVLLTRKRSSIEGEEVLRLFDIFGHLVNKLKIAGDAFNLNLWPIRDKIFEKIQATTSGGLRELSLAEFILLDEESHSILSLNANLTKIELVDCITSDSLLAVVSKFKELENAIFNKSGSKSVTYPNYTPITQNLSLKRLVLRNNWNLGQWEFINIIEWIAPNLEIIELNDGHEPNCETGLLKLANLKKLKKLTVNFRNREAAPLLKKLIENEIKLEEITLIACDTCDDFISPLKELKKLKKLTFAEMYINIRELKEVVTQLTELEEITLNNISLNTRAVLKLLCGEKSKKSPKG